MTAAPSDRRAIITEALRKIDDLTARLKIAEQGDTEPIAVVGMGCRLPGGADSPDKFWRLLQDGGHGIGGGQVLSSTARKSTTRTIAPVPMCIGRGLFP